MLSDPRPASRLQLLAALQHLYWVLCYTMCNRTGAVADQGGQLEYRSPCVSSGTCACMHTYVLETAIACIGKELNSIQRDDVCCHAYKYASTRARIRLAAPPNTYHTIMFAIVLIVLMNLQRQRAIQAFSEISPLFPFQRSASSTTALSETCRRRRRRRRRIDDDDEGVLVRVGEPDSTMRRRVDLGPVGTALLQARPVHERSQTA